MIRAFHYTAAALFVLPILAHATGPEPGWIERDPAPISPVISEIIDGVARPVHGIRDNGPCGETRPCVGIVTPETIPAIPLPPALWLLAGAVGVLLIVRRKS